jgi:hypothetical protein
LLHEHATIVFVGDKYLTPEITWQGYSPKRPS